MSAINQIVAVGSVDGVCTAAALLRLTGNPHGVGLEFSQAFTVYKVNPFAWKKGRRIAFVDLAVNNREVEMTRAFVNSIKTAGHSIVAIIDEHSREDWLSVLGSFEDLMIEPETQLLSGGPRSSGEVLRRSLIFDKVDDHTEELLNAAEAADRMNFMTHFGKYVNQAVKSAICDDRRRTYIAKHFAINWQPDARILGWMREYEQILENHEKVLETRVDLGGGIHRVKVTGLAVDMTTLLRRIYSEGARVIVLEGETYNRSTKTRIMQLSFVTCDKSLDLIAIMLKVGLPITSVFNQKVGVGIANEEKAVRAIQKATRERARYKYNR